MNKLILTSLITLSVLGINLSSCSNSATKTDATQNGTAAVYACPMHPEVKSDKPGSCSKCGMDLEKVENTATDSTVKQ